MVESQGTTNYFQMKKEKNAVVKERLLAVSMFLDGVPKGEIKKLMHRGANFVGTWISTYFEGEVEALADNRGGNHITSWSTKGVLVSHSGYSYGTSLNCFGSFNLNTGHLISSFHDRENTFFQLMH